MRSYLQLPMSAPYVHFHPVLPTSNCRVSLWVWTEGTVFLEILCSQKTSLEVQRILFLLVPLHRPVASRRLTSQPFIQALT